MSDDMKPMTWEAVRATTQLAEEARAKNAAVGGFACNRCADTRIVPAPEPYGSWGCTWPCPECAQDDIIDVLRNARIEGEHP